MSREPDPVPGPEPLSRIAEIVAAHRAHEAFEECAPDVILSEIEAEIEAGYWIDRAARAERRAAAKNDAAPEPKMCGNSDHAHFDEWVRFAAARPSPDESPVADLRERDAALGALAAVLRMAEYADKGESWPDTIDSARYVIETDGLAALVARLDAADAEEADDGD